MPPSWRIPRVAGCDRKHLKSLHRYDIRCVGYTLGMAQKVFDSRRLHLEKPCSTRGFSASGCRDATAHTTADALDVIPKRLVALAFLVLCLLGAAAAVPPQSHAVAAAGSVGSVPRPAPVRMVASCYGPGLWFNSTANGTTLRHGTLGVAHKTLPLGTRLIVRVGVVEVQVSVIDRGPFVRGRDLDVTEATSRALGVGSCRAWGHRTVKTWRIR